MSTLDHMPWDDDRAAYLLSALDASERVVFEQHLAGCERCRAELRWFQPALDVLPASVEQLEPPPGLRERILAAIAHDGRTPAAPATARSRPERPSRWSRLLRGPALAGAVAVVAVAAGIGIGLLAGDDDAGRVETRTVAVEAAAHAARASGTVVRHGDVWTLDVARMPKLEPGDVYQVWIRQGDEIKPSVLFVLTPDRRAQVALPGERIDTADQLMVTREPSGGSPTPTSDPLLSATLQ